MTFTVRSVRAVGFRVLIEQICGANLMLIVPKENVSLRVQKFQIYK